VNNETPFNIAQPGFELGYYRSVANRPGPEKYFYSSLAPWLVKFDSTSPTNLLLAQQKILAIKTALQSTETIINICNKDNNDVFVVLLSIQQFIFHPVINYLLCSPTGQEFSSCGH